jgi:hypothetical protein
MGPSLQVVFDANDVSRLVEFWEQALTGYEQQPPPPGFATWSDWAREQGIPESDWDAWGALIDPQGDRPRIFFQRVPEPKIAKNRVHLDLNVGGDLTGDERITQIRREAERVEALGATRQREFDQRGEFWIVMQDPEGNEFCLQ